MVRIASPVEFRDGLNVSTAVFDGLVYLIVGVEINLKLLESALSVST